MSLWSRITVRKAPFLYRDFLSWVLVVVGFGANDIPVLLALALDYTIRRGVR